ncbi:MAG: plasmid stabilization protein [Alphaproteobacteria bacterium]|nr:plasmid stabilization protein [Alphaproteobacteria bacterium]
MASITIRNLDENLKRRLRVQAAEHGRSMEEEVREILRQTVGQSPRRSNLAQSIRARVAGLGGAEIAVPPRQSMREPPDFE